MQCHAEGDSVQGRHWYTWQCIVHDVEILVLFELIVTSSVVRKNNCACMCPVSIEPEQDHLDLYMCGQSCSKRLVIFGVKLA